MKKIIILFISLIMLISNLSGIVVLADDLNEDGRYVPVFPQNSSVISKTKLPVVDATAVIVIEAGTGRVLYEKNAYIKKAMASTTKIMTAIVALENGNLDDIVTASKRAAGISGSQIDLTIGEKLTLRELLYGLMLESGNDAAIAIAEHIGGSVEDFCELMNKKAIELGATNTHFTSPHGLDSPEHYTTAYEMAIITRYALNNPTFSKIVSTVSTNIPKRSLYNTNELLGVYPGADGVKTGYTGQAGRCLVTTALRNNMRLISVVFGSPTRNARAQSSRNILDYAFNNYKRYTLMKSGESIGKLKVIKGIVNDVEVKAVEELTVPLKQEEYESLQKDVKLTESLNAPVSANIEVGTVSFSINGNVIASTPLVTSNNVRRKTFKDYFQDIIYEWGRIMRPNIKETVPQE